MNSWQLLLMNWEFEPSVVIGCAVILLVYFFAAKWKFDRKGLKFTLGIAVIFLALTSPIDPLGDDYLFSAHMVQHMMLGIVAPVLLVSGIPAAFVQAWLKIPGVAFLEKFLSYPPLALLVANATFWVWHLPSLYNLTLANETVHITEHMLFIITGVMLWWPVFKPIMEGRLHPLAAMIYLGIAAFISTILGMIFTVSDTPYYSGYANPEDELGALKMIREQWGLTQIADQKLGGAIMWEPAGVVFLWAIMRIMIGWFQEKSELDPGQPDEAQRENAGAN